MNLFILSSIIIPLVILFFVISSIFELPLKRVTIFEFEKGLKFINGKFQGVLSPGRYWCTDFQQINTPNLFTSYSYKKSSDRVLIKKIDIRPVNIVIPAQELLTLDNISIKITFAAKYEIIDPVIVFNKVQNFYDSLYADIQVFARELIGNIKIDELLENRNSLNEKLFQLSVVKAEELGIKLHFVTIKDIIFPGELKQVFAQVMKAQKEGLALLEKARGETAALRNLANASKMLENNQSLLYLRMIQAVEGSKGNSIYIGINPENNILNKDKSQ